jgi:hypothetical protein
MRADGVVGTFPVAEFTIEFFIANEQGLIWWILGVGAVGAFDGAIDFGGARGKHEQMEAALARPDGKGHAV